MFNPNNRRIEIIIDKNAVVNEKNIDCIELKKDDLIYEIYGCQEKREKIIGEVFCSAKIGDVTKYYIVDERCKNKEEIIDTILVKRVTDDFLDNNNNNNLNK